MKATCDICGKKDTWIEPLVSEYATDEVKGVCSECKRTLNSHLDDIRKLQRKILFSWMRRFIDALKDKYRLALLAEVKRSGTEVEVKAIVSCGG